MVLLIVFCIALAIILGYITKCNVGIFAIVFAYIIGTFLMDMDPKKILGFWPISIFFVILAVSLFYNFAIVNGTLEKLANHLMYRFVNYPYLLPFVVFISSAIIAALGAGFYTVLAFMAPLTFLLCDKAGLSKIAGAMAINYGALGGANFMTSQSGIIFRTLMENSGVQANAAFLNSGVIFITTIIIPIFVLSFFVLSAFKNKIQLSSIVKPQVFDKKQKITLFLMLLMMFIVLIGPILHVVFPKNILIDYFNKKIDIAMIAIIFVAIALFLKLADEKKVIALIPWNTLIMICGVGMLIGVAIEAKTIDLLSSAVRHDVYIIFIPIILCIVAAFMSFFSSTLGVVTPALFPIVPSIALSSGLNETLLFVCIVVGAQASAISPFSSGGSLILGACPQNYKEKLFKDLLIKAIPLGFIAAILAAIILSFILKGN
ncbi:SLC13 family permease [Campylobacter aviculae]|uniref:C4-dicarboxylate ABC transporter n=1 Tax=Campylobacter aviculae TaxID=2510190 RepID=A0A4U7BPT1_9BACT|nr:SLC13 family permease [Campylobacter aviculae]TKX32751.1 C4-dicarboxylate ABC transporter [Campylobacter aviculae]